MDMDTGTMVGMFLRLATEVLLLLHVVTANMNGNAGQYKIANGNPLSEKPYSTDYDDKASSEHFDVYSRKQFFCSNSFCFRDVYYSMPSNILQSGLRYYFTTQQHSAHSNSLFRGVLEDAGPGAVTGCHQEAVCQCDHGRDRLRGRSGLG
jgi:hypothetical protein